ncbi:hypothetical protein [Hydrogenophaga sp.]|uniref:hypothetical protein n=1 Tax=Hydrogenophaga sp. TaxID=1904254 RepID=UPI0027253154|nr:hypothetical protein [Hydrogenophaga sp.]MDO9437709.1 hypothetical protein [Hydrogenophaga sp.]
MGKTSRKALSINDIALPTFPPRDFRLSKHSVYQDDKWALSDDSNVRLKGHSEAKLSVDWSTYRFDRETHESSLNNVIAKSHLDARVSDGIVEDIRLLTFVQLEMPSVFGKRGLQIQRSKPPTVVSMARALVVLFSVVDTVRAERVTAVAASLPYTPLQSVSEISFQDLESALKKYPFVDGRLLERALRAFASPVLRGKFSGASVQWTEGDIGNLTFPKPTPRDSESVMPDAMFRMLSNTASKDVACFLSALQLHRYDQTVPVQLSGLLPREIILAEAWEDYVAIRNDDRDYTAKLGRKSARTANRRKDFTREHGISNDDFFTYISDLQRGCMMLIGLYTGGRFSDFTSFVAGCIEEVHGMPMLVGTMAKHRPLNAPVGEDIWPAIPILRDAVTCLEEISRVTFNPYLVSSTYTVAIGEKPQPLSISGFRNGLTLYLQSADADNRWSDWVISPHQLRHTLAHKLAQADVGIVYISYQLKHLYTALAGLPADVTLGYGNIGEQKLARAMAVKDLSREAANALFNPDSPIAGGGAKEFRQRRKVYFDGRVAEGWTQDEIIDQLAACGSPFVNVGPGYCGGVREEELADGTKRPPPCIGNLQCNTGDCDNAVVTQIHLSQWKDIVVKNKELASDPRLAHAADNFKAAITTGERVLRDLGVNSATL